MQALISALIAARRDFAPIRKNKRNTFLNTWYATLDTVLDAIEVPLAKHGLTIVQTTKIIEGRPVLVTSLYHTSGEVISGEYPLPITDEAQKLGAAITYGRRYALCALLSIAADEEESDSVSSNNGNGTDRNNGNGHSNSNGNKAPKSGNGTITKDEWERRKAAAPQ